MHVGFVCVCVCVYMCVMHIIQCAYVSVCMREGRVAEREGERNYETVLLLVE